MKIICEANCAPQQKPVKGNGWTLFTSVVALLMPKCALCWASYMSILNALGLMTLKYQPWFLPLSILLLIITLIKLLFAAIWSRKFTAFCMALTGGLIIVYQKLGNPVNGLNLPALILLMTAVMMDNILRILFTKL